MSTSGYLSQMLRFSCNVANSSVAGEHVRSKGAELVASMRSVESAFNLSSDVWLVREIAGGRHIRYGFGASHIMLKRDGWPVNPKRIHRLCKEMETGWVPRRRARTLFYRVAKCAHTALAKRGPST